MADKAVGKALVVPISASSIVNPIPSVVATKPLAPKPREPIISKELAQHKKWQKGSKGEIRLCGCSSPASPGSYLVSFWDSKFWSDIFIDACLDPLSNRRLLDLGQPAAFHQVEY